MKKEVPLSGLLSKLEALEQQKCELDQQKVRTIFEYIGIEPHKFDVHDCLKWDRILISVPDQDTYLELQQLESYCDRIAFILNRHSEAYFVCDYNDWRQASKGKEKADLQRLLKEGFGSFSQN